MVTSVADPECFILDLTFLNSAPDSNPSLKQDQVKKDLHDSLKVYLMVQSDF
jgi:hypothetical protein